MEEARAHVESARTIPRVYPPSFTPCDIRSRRAIRIRVRSWLLMHEFLLRVWSAPRETVKGLIQSFGYAA
ncbi:hypothetical protein GCM10010392_15480 [Streptomyces clavifer]|nr:hypothetical protein GCM10010392_15480 [Streptomyces clavifer]